MKKISVYLLIVILSVIQLAGCKSSEAKNVEALIASIGDVSLSSGDAINNAESAFNALSDKDKKAIKSSSTLTEARSL